MDALMSVGCSLPPTKDTTFYLEDGDTTISVSGTLFKVHRYILARDGSVFKQMFTTDPPSSSDMTETPMDQDGRDEEHPIVLQGDTADEFRSLLWLLYALPQEIADATMGKDRNLLRLCSALKLAHKYSFQTTEAWATDALSTCTTKTIRERGEISLELLEKLTAVAILCGDASQNLLKTVRTRWRILIAEKKNLTLLMRYTEQLGLRDLEGCAYHAMMLEGRDVWNADPLLTRQQHIRLLSGFYNLSRYGRSLQYDPPPLTHDAVCHNHVLCSIQWANLWEVINARTESGIGMQAMPQDKTDLLGRLMMAVSIMKSFVEQKTPFLEDHEFSSSPCRQAAYTATVEMHARWSREVIVFFSDIPSSVHS